jgi:pepF/M3 family oligoendopeptidase
VRERAYRAELGAWQQHATPLAAAMNGIKGQVGVVAKLRGYETPLDEALADNHLDRATLTALVDASETAFPAFRRYLAAKARLLGLERLSWFDLFAPVGAAARPEARDRWNYPASIAFIERHFRSYSDALADLSGRSNAEHWIDAGPRAGKVAGAYCMPFGREQSRILANFTPSYGGMATLAHELGHAYHNYTQRDEPGLRRGSPMVVAETASTFCETLIRHAGLAEATEADRIVILEAFLTDSTQLVLDILSRFRFERAVFEHRADHQLSADELSELMLDAQRSTYGNGLTGEALHPFAWASKPHYYSAERSFYNYPYLFGSLFGIGLFATYQAEPDGFQERYDDLLRRTGQASPADLAADFGVDIRDRAFWARSLASLESSIDQFVALVDQQVPAS